MVTAHYLRLNESEWSPRHVGFLDTETTPTRDGNRETHALRMWVYSHVDRRPGPDRKTCVESSHGALPESLADAVEASLVGRPNIWIFAHNLGFDLTTTRLIDHMTGRGWELGELQFTGRNVRAYLKRRTKSIWLIDSWSWLTTSLDQLGRLVGQSKLPMPAWDATEEEWFDYCSRDVSVLAESMLTALDWWDREKLGHWSRSGPATGWNAMRHMSRKRSFTIQVAGGGREHDRLAVRGGRRDATRVGQIAGGPFALLDFENAHLTVARHCPLPKMRAGHRDSFTIGELRRLEHTLGVLAECEVETSVPRYPLRVDGGIFYPVGRFRTVLAHPEIEWAASNGDLRAIGAGYRHDMGFGLQRWADWALRTIDPANLDVPPVVKAMVKQWGRSVIGKFAGRTSRVTDRGVALFPDWHVERGTALPDHLPTWDVHAGGRYWHVVGDQESDNAYPAVLAWVESYVRVALGRMLEALGEDLWVSCDTDGCIVDLSQAAVWLSERRARRCRLSDPTRLAKALCDELGGLTAPLTPRVKMVAESLFVAGPQHFAADSFVKAAGRPQVEVDPVSGEHRHMVWPGLAWQMEHGSRDGYVRREHDWTEPMVTVHRWVTTDGRAIPPWATIGKDGSSAVVRWLHEDHCKHTADLAEVQAPALRNLQ